jgi:hypothetical protein
MQGTRGERYIARNCKEPEIRSAYLRGRNERMMRGKIQINSRVLQSLNQSQGQSKNVSNKEEEGKIHERRDDRGRVGYSKSASRAHRHHSPPYSTIKFHVYEYSLSIP